MVEEALADASVKGGALAAASPRGAPIVLLLPWIFLIV
jgi:hypothetical protein